MSSDTIQIDGSEGEGGGQILRSSLSLSLLTGKAVRVANIRAGRKKPGLLRQHLTAVKAAAAIGKAQVEGAEIHSQELYFEPTGIFGGEYTFSVGTAGSATLVCQSVLLPLLKADVESRVIFEGGTHNPHSPPFEFFAKTYLPLLERMGASVEAKLIRPGFYPAGGGSFEVRIAPCADLQPLELLSPRGESAVSARAVVSNLPIQIAKRELTYVREQLGLGRELTQAIEVDTATGPGNVVSIEVKSATVCEQCTAFGEKGVSAEQVAADCVAQAKRYLATEVPVGEHLADQLLLPCAVAGAGAYLTLRPSAHTRSNAVVIEKFLDVSVDCIELAEDRFEIEISRRTNAFAEEV